MIWGGIYDANSSTGNYDGYISLQNIYSNIFCVLSIFAVYITPFILFNLKTFLLYLKKNYLYLFLITIIILILPFEYKWWAAKISLGGGMILKGSLLIFNDYIFFKLYAAFGIIILSFLFYLNKNNFYILFPILIIFCLPKIFFQEYMDPLIYIISIFFLDFRNKKFIIDYKFVIFLLFYQIIILSSSIFYQHIY